MFWQDWAVEEVKFDTGRMLSSLPYKGGSSIAQIAWLPQSCSPWNASVSSRWTVWKSFRSWNVPSQVPQAHLYYTAQSAARKKQIYLSTKSGESNSTTVHQCLYSRILIASVSNPHGDYMFHNCAIAWCPYDTVNARGSLNSVESGQLQLTGQSFVELQLYTNHCISMFMIMK